MNIGEALTVFGEHAKIPAPGTVHILVAGFACVDFSMLNNKRKELVVNLDDLPPERMLELLGGESSVTLTAILKYVRQYRPPILILENILGASWPSILRLFDEIDYSVGVARLDTKHFYIPQTRQRGYLIGISHRKNQGVGGLTKSAADAAVQKWAQALNELMRPASSPVDDFLLDDEHPDLVKAQQSLNKESGRGSATRIARDWSVCWGRYQRFRETRGLGTKAPYTQWRSGKVKPPEHAKAMWLQKQSNRVKDTFDCVYLLSASQAQRDYDASHKSRLPEASQNIDRSVDMAKPGIVGCITPNNILFHTGKARPPSGLELLRLQGLDSNRLLVSREGQGRLRDLAGNAMSTTVVGSAIIAALIAASDAIDPATLEQPQKIRQIAGIPHEIGFDPQSELVATNTPDFGPQERHMSVQHFCELAARSTRMCYCEGSWNQASSPISKCKECQHTSCVRCGGNPVHVFEALETEQRYDPRMFIKTASRYLPTRLRLQNFRALNHLILRVVNSLIVEETLSNMTATLKATVEREKQELASKNKKKAIEAKRLLKLEKSLPGNRAMDQSRDVPVIVLTPAADQTKRADFKTDPEDILSKHFASEQESVRSKNSTIILSNSVDQDPQHVSRQDESPVESVFAQLLISFDFAQEDLKMLPLARSHQWTITYESEHLRLKLVMDGQNVEWLLYLKCSDDLPAGSSIRQVLNQPIATMVPNLQQEKSCIWEGQWIAKIYSPQEHQVRILNQGRRVPSWKAEIGLKGYEMDVVFDRIGIYPISDETAGARKEILRHLSGEYQLLPLCGTATRCLHRRVQPDTSRGNVPYLFLDSLPNQPSSLDNFVIALDHERNFSGEPHRYLARIITMQQPQDEKDQQEAISDATILSSLMNKLSSEDYLTAVEYLTRKPSSQTTSNPLPSQLNLGALSKNAKCWRPSLTVSQIAKIVVDFQVEAFEGILNPVENDNHFCAMTISPEFLAEPRMFQQTTCLLSGGHEISVHCQAANVLLMKYNMPWHGRNPDGRCNYNPCQITELNQRCMQLNLNWLTSRIEVASELRMWNPIIIDADDMHCEDCSPTLPDLITRQMPRGGLMLMEDPEAVAKFLRVWKLKPVPLTVTTQRTRDSSNRQDLRICINLQCLLHRLLSRIPSSIHDAKAKLNVAWRICTDVSIDRGNGRLGALRVHDCTQENPLHYNFGSSGFSLRGDQARVFRWMIGRDTFNADHFQEIVVEESVSTHLHWSVEAQAIRTIKARGGLCADHVGFGKTVVMLATIREHIQQAKTESANANANGSGKHIHIPATLVLVPGSLTFQWVDEIEKFWSDCTYIMVNNMEDLSAYSVQDFKNADIVIVSVDMFAQGPNRDYMERTAEIAGVARPATFTRSRQHLQWSKAINTKIEVFVQDLQNEDLSHFDCMDRLRARAHESSLTTAEYLDPSKRLRGKKFIANQRAQILGKAQNFTHGSAINKSSRIPGEIIGFPLQYQRIAHPPVPSSLSKKQQRFMECQHTHQHDDDATTMDHRTVTKHSSHIVPSSIAQSLRVVTQSAYDAKNFFGPVFNMFHFHRKVIDEITYLSQQQEVTIKSIPSTVTWLLSGTARVRDPMDVHRLASMIGVHTGVADDSRGHNAPRNRAWVHSDRSEVERIEAGKVVHTEAWHHRRLFIAQSFLDKFARTNQVELPPSTRIRLKEIILPVRLSAIHSALYHEVHTLLLSEDFKDNSAMKGRGQHDRTLRTGFVLHHTLTIEEALIKAAFFVPRGEGYSMMQHQCHELPDASFQEVLATRADDVVRLTRAVLRRSDAFAYWLEHEFPAEGLDKKDTNFLLDVLKRIIWLLNTRLFKRLLDSDASDQLHRLHSKYELLTSEYAEISPKRARKRLDKLGRLVDAMVSSVRAYRYLKNAQRLQEAAWNQDKTFIVDDVGHLTEVRNARLNGLCGHVICESCLRNLTNPICPVDGCGGGAGQKLFIHAEDLGESSPDNKFPSAKIQTALNIIKALNKDSQALVFSQWHDMNEILVYYLERAGINTIYVRDGEKDTAKKVAAFKALPENHPSWVKVMILNPLSSSAAGHNLQNVSAVIFLSPLTDSSIEEYKAAYIQCIGRAARFGQKDIVKVYHLLASKTIEVNIHESRRGTKTYVQNGQTLELSAGATIEPARPLAASNY